MGSKIKKIDEKYTENKICDNGFTIENIVATLDLKNEFDLMALSEQLSKTEYEPETHPFLVYRPQSTQGSALIPSNGKISLVGCKCKSEIIELGTLVIKRLSKITDKELPDKSNIMVENIVIQGDLEQNIKLPPIVALLGIERSEYEPEQFPGIVHKNGDGTTTLIFSSGKFIINGANTYKQAISSASNLLLQLYEADVPGNFKSFEGIL
jgi:transcription initiation factor TFIID TATA-box-binding protein